MQSKNRMTEKKNYRRIGNVYERAVGFYLEQHGYEILEFNYRCPMGEIDLIAKEGGSLVFCEVKYRKDQHCGSAEEAVDERKQRRIWKAALYYLTVHGIGEVPCRFDVIGIADGKISVIKNAFEGGTSWI